jgi:phenylalanine-4-hydroxylase
LFWYTVEFGLIRQHGLLKVYGSGLISSDEECTKVIKGECQVRDFNLDDVMETSVKVDEMHQVLFAIESFDQLYEAIEEAEKKLSVGRGRAEK